MSADVFHRSAHGITTFPSSGVVKRPVVVVVVVSVLVGTVHHSTAMLQSGESLKRTNLNVGCLGGATVGRRDF